jgi:diguanylate cyclase (GGDEF)-like protein
MLSLYQALLAQHARQLTPVRCAAQTIAQLHHYFEDVVLENNLSALVVESLFHRNERSPQIVARACQIASASNHAFFFVAPDDPLVHALPTTADVRTPVLLTRTPPTDLQEHFILIADTRFSALLVTKPNAQAETDAADSFDEHDVIWTFEPDIAYSALEYLMARTMAERHAQSQEFAAAVRNCVPKTTSLQLTVSVTTKLARLLQEQAAREVAVNRIANAIRSTLELPVILQTTVDEVGRALGAEHCALRVAGETEQESVTKFYSHAAAPDVNAQAELLAHLDEYHTCLATQRDAHTTSEASTADTDEQTGPFAHVPLICQQTYVGVLLVRADDARRTWQKSERLLLRTVADQVALAVSHARLFAQIERQALTDALTGCVNRRAFDLQLERDLQLATRIGQPFSLVMLDIDHFKRVNDTHGHDAGDAALKFLADVLRAELRVVDTAARYGGEEFAIILPQAAQDGALIVAERLRARLEQTEVPGIGRITASFGLATFPVHAATAAQLVTIADRALYEAKHAGRNRIATPPQQDRQPDKAAPVSTTSEAKLPQTD